LFGRLLNLKDKGVSLAAKTAINVYLQKEGYGEMLKLNLDSQNKKLDAEIMLKGEKEPLSVSIDRYEIIDRDGETFIKLSGIETSREWINILVASEVEGKEFKIPSQYKDKLSMII